MSKLADKLGGAMRSSLGVGHQPSAGAPQAANDLYAGTRATSDTRLVPVDKIIPDSNQPRKEFPPEALAELGLSLKRRGQLQAIRVREDRENNRFIIVSGERRWRAAKMMEIKELMCTIIKRPMTDGERLTESLIENCVREGLSVFDQGRAYRALMTNEGWTAEQVARELNISPQTVGRALAVIDLPEPVQELVEAGALPPSTAAELRSIATPEEQVEVATRIAAEKRPRDAAVAEIREHAPKRRKPAAPASVSYAVPGGTVTIRGRELCQDADSRVRALEEAIAQAGAA